MSTLRRRIDDDRRTSEPQRHQGGRRPGWFRAVFFARADSIYSSGSAAGRRVAPRRAVRLSRECLLHLAALPRRRWSAPRRSSSCGRSSTASASRSSRRLRYRRRRHAAKIWRACAPASHGVSSRPRRRHVLTRSTSQARVIPGDRHDAAAQDATNAGALAAARQIHPGHRRRRLVARQRAGRRIHWRAPRGTRLQGRAAEVRPLHQRRSRER